jgi:hypothetical protein
MGEAEIGGPMLNIVPKTGGNIFSGTVFGSGAGEWAQGSNIDDELRAFGITEQAALIKLWDVSFALGGPIKRDKLWFFANYRDFGNHTDIPGLYANLHEGNASRWDYEPNLAIKTRTATAKTVVSSRLTTQATPRNKFSFYYDYQWDCDQGSQSTEDGCRTKGGDYNFGTVFGSGFSSEGNTNYWDAARSSRKPPGRRRSPTSCSSKPAMPPSSAAGAGCRSPA